MEEQAATISKFGENLNVAALDSMVFLGNIVLESARMEINVGPFRLVKQPATYKDYTLPVGNIPSPPPLEVK